MSPHQPHSHNTLAFTETPAPADDDPSRRTCAGVMDEVNAEIGRRCAGKVNLLSCRCSGCDNDLPVIVSPSDAPLLNSAYDGGGGFLTSGTDAGWEVGLGDPSGPGSVSTWIPAFVFRNAAWVASPFANANWISYFANGNQGGNNVDAYYRYRFNLGSSVDPATFALTMSFFADNRVWEIWVNQVAQSTLPNGAAVLPQFPAQPPSQYQTHGFIAGAGVRITLDNAWRRCENELVVHVMSGPGELGFLAQNAVDTSGTDGCDCRRDCAEAAVPALRPCISVGWGDAPCDCLETNDVEVLCVSACNCYSNVTFRDFTIARVQVTDMAGNPVADLPDGTPSVQVVPSGALCFGDLEPCTHPDGPRCVSREVVLRTRGAVGQPYRLSFSGVCFGVTHAFQSDQCFLMELCRD